MKSIPVMILGAGGVGQALIRQLVAGRDTVARRAGVRFAVHAVADSKGWLRGTPEIDDDRLADVLKLKAQGQALGQPRPDAVSMVHVLASAGISPLILVDLTAAGGLEPALNAALEAGFGVVLANKKALAGPWGSARPFYHHPRLRHESTVGGGQPVIATLRYLLDTNDPVQRIAGQLSGTLGYICQQLDTGRPFSQALADARSQGFTEPDPREDLGGEDVRRKALILARMAGWPLEAQDIAVESLVPPTLADLAVDDFMAAAAALDAPLAARVQAAAESDQVLRYLAEVDVRRAEVGLRPVPASSPLANLKYVSFQTAHYHDEPLVIAGKGAGVEMTAAGVLGDMIALAREQLV